MSIYTIHKKTGTYSELLETYGLANLLHKIFDAVNLPDTEIVITDREYCFEVSTNVDITDEMLTKKLKYFPPFKYIKQKQDSDVSKCPDYYDYPTQSTWKKEQQGLLNAAYKKEKEERIREIERINRIYETEKPRDIEYDVYSQIAEDSNNFPSFDKLYRNFLNNQEIFCDIIKEILSYYQNKSHNTASLTFKKYITEKVTALQIFNPTQGKGLNSKKANDVKGVNFASRWITETMKISGALSDMVCQLVKVGARSFDLKIFVPEYKQLNFAKKFVLIPKFKKYAKGNTPIKIDVLYILLLTKLLIENTEYSGRRRKIKDIVSGLHSVYQKSMGRKRAVVNIGFIQIPNFIEIGSKEDVQEWTEFLDNQMIIIGGMKEERDATPGLMMYRNFISGSSIDEFFKFSYWYAEYLMSQLSKQNKPKTFTINTLNKLYISMDKQEINLKSIIENDGFKAVAEAIRKSTVSLQYTSKERRKYEIRYGVAQALQTRSKTKADLAEYIGDFISLYNAETSRKAEKDNRAFRKNVREDKLSLFYELLDYYPSKLVGALLASYGFALPNRDSSTNDEYSIVEETEE